MGREIEELKATIACYQRQVKDLRKGYAECIEDLADWGKYAGDYMMMKHDLDGDIKRHKKILGVE